MIRKYLPPFVQTHNLLIVKNLDTSIINTKVKRNAAYVRKTMKHAIMNAHVMGYETSKLITSDTDLERGNAQRERWKIATTC